MPNETLRKTPLHACHLQLKAKLVPFAGYEMPVQYTGLLDETKATRSAAGLFDVSHMGQFSVRGKHSLEEVQKLVTNDLSRLSLGQAQYNMLCNDKGGVIDDLVVYRRSETETYICVNASNRAEDFAWMRSHLASSVELEDQSDDTALIALQGPKAEAILTAVSDEAAVRGVKYYWAVETKVFGLPCFLSRTGYTGEDGFELYVRAKDAATIWNGLLEKGKPQGLVPVGLGARDTLRLEMGYPLHGHELSKAITPLMANLGWVVKLQRPTPFIGQEALRKEAAAGPARTLKAFVIEDRRIARQGYKIVGPQGTIGEITSGTLSPHVNAPVALGFVDRGAAQAESVSIEVRNDRIPARVVKLPFVPSRAKKN